VQTKKEGCTGLRRIADTVTAAGVKLVRRLCSSSSSWAVWTKKILKEKHCPKQGHHLLILIHGNG